MMHYENSKSRLTWLIWTNSCITENPFAPKILMPKCLYVICISLIFFNDILQFTRESKVVLGQ